MIAVGMKHPAMTHAVAGFVAAVKRWGNPLFALQFRNSESLEW